MSGTFDPDPVDRAAAVAQLRVLEPEISGLRKWVSIRDISGPFKSALNAQIVIKQRRWDLIERFLAALDASIGAYADLLADGYPSLPQAVVEPEIISEFKQDRTELLVAIGVFQPPDPVAVGFNKDAPFTDVPQARPAQS